MTYLWIGGDYECNIFALTDDDTDPANVLLQTGQEGIIAGNKMEGKPITKEEADTIAKHIPYVHDLRVRPK